MGPAGHTYTTVLFGFPNKIITTVSSILIDFRNSAVIGSCTLNTVYMYHDINWSARDAWLHECTQIYIMLFVHDPLSSSGYPMITYTNKFFGCYIGDCNPTVYIHTYVHTHVHKQWVQIYNSTIFKLP